MNRRNMLVVEDHDATRNTLRTIFVRKGWDVAAVATVAEALDRLARGPEPDVLILDLMLPDGDGEVVLRAVRDARLKTRVAVCTGACDPPRMEALARLAPEATLQKPIHLPDVCALCGVGEAI